ncbi:MAG TPA: tol-pal system protein YbgF [Steroidobacteraceae bacterium]
MRSIIGLAVCAVLAGCATAPEQDPVVQKLTELDGRLLRIERVLANQSLLDLSQRIEASQNEIRTLRGQLEELQHHVNRTQDQLREQYTDVDRRVSALEAGAVPTASSRGGSGGALPIPQGDDRANYQAAFDLLKEGKYSEATAAFKQFIATFPDSSLSDNAWYWLGESYYVTRQYGEALKSFRTVVERYPASRKMPDALLKIGYCNYELKNWAEARAALNQVVQQYGDTTAARLASQRLAKMEGEGH